MEILISLSLTLLMAFCLDIPLMADLTEFITLRLTLLLRYTPHGSIFVDEGL
jgi:hypothetical protein